jgi:hypothetical protein
MPRVQSSQRSLLSKKKLASARKQKTQTNTGEQAGGYYHNVPIRIPIKMKINPYAPSPLPVSTFNPNNNKLNSMVNMLDNNLKMLIYLVDADKLKQVQNIINSNMDVRKPSCGKRTLYRQSSRHPFILRTHKHHNGMPMSPAPMEMPEFGVPPTTPMPHMQLMPLAPMQPKSRKHIQMKKEKLENNERVHVNSNNMV